MKPRCSSSGAQVASILTVHKVITDNALPANTRLDLTKLGIEIIIREHGFHLPPFAHWTPDQWRAAGPEEREIVQRKRGWDVADFKQGDFRTNGLLLFTIRNYDVRDPASKPYAE